jgi:fucose 4-O-acetylase-like acetyltransferase
MIYVLISHVVQRIIPNGSTTILFGIFYSVHMAIFMFVSGYFIKRCQNFKEVLNYIKKIFIVYIIPSIIFTLITVLTIKSYYNHDLLHWMKTFIVSTASFYWYGVAAFIINSFLAISYFIASKVNKKDGFKSNLLKNIYILITLLVFIIPFILLYLNGNMHFLSTNLLLEFIPFTVVGFLYRSFEHNLKELKKINIIKKILYLPSLVIYSILLIKYPGYHMIDSNTSMLLHQIGSLCGVFLYFNLIKYLCNFNMVFISLRSSKLLIIFYFVISSSSSSKYSRNILFLNLFDINKVLISFCNL